MMSYIERYRKGEYVQVWSDLFALGEQVSQEPLLYQAVAVSRETMKRVRYNIQLLIPRLSKIGFRFENPQSAFCPPSSNITHLIAETEQISGKIPLSIHSWYEIVGSVSFMGMHPEWNQYFEGEFLPDPLVVFPLESVLEECNHKNWEQNMFSTQAIDLYHLAIAPDKYHKSNISGDEPYCIELPSPSIDAILVGERHNTTFVNYLRLCFQWGGFPGFEQFKSYPIEVMSYLIKDLLPL